MPSFLSANRVGASEADPEAQAVDPSFKPGTAANATSSIEITVSCRNLANKDVLSKSDPICVIYNRLFNSKKWVELMRTEQIDNDLNPDFAKKLTMEYRFEQQQHLRFEIYDVDSADASLEEAESIGYTELTVANIVAAGPKGFQGKLKNMDDGEEDESNGTIIVIAEELMTAKDEIALRLVGVSMGSVFNCFMPKTLFAISRINDGGIYNVVHRSKEVRGHNPSWPSLTISGRSLCNGDKDRQLKVEAWKKTIKDELDLIGCAYTTVNKLATSADENMQLITKTGGTSNASIAVVSCTVTPVFTFFDFIQAGTKLHLCFSIDFTSSNGDPTAKSSLHHISQDPNCTNAYEQAITATGLVIKDYDNTGIFPVYGFGARIPPIGETSHLFPVNLTNNPSCHGIEGVLKAYKSCISRVQLFGPTSFAPVINRISSLAENCRMGQHYYILVILTDGVLTDLVQTKEAIIRASSLPISIVIVGVGESNFDSMEELDGDLGQVSYMGKVAERDIVQFVEYRSADSWMKRTGESTGKDVNKETLAARNATLLGENAKLTAQGQLAEEILAEIPDQITGYFKSKGINPDMVAKLESNPEEAFAGLVEPDPAEVARMEKEKIRRIKKSHGGGGWNLLNMVNKGVSKFRASSPTGSRPPQHLGLPP